jgi:hypothetical protein
MTHKLLSFGGNKIYVCPLAAHDTSYPILITGSPAVGLALEISDETSLWMYPARRVESKMDAGAVPCISLTSP